MASQEDVVMATDPAPHQSTTTITNKSTQQQQRITSRNPQWTYFKLQLIPHSNHPIRNFAVDPLTARSYLTSALSQFLGLMGTSIWIDILGIENPSPPPPQPTEHHDHQSSKRDGDVPNVWIRVPRDDGAAVLAALSSWVGSFSSAAAAASASASVSTGAADSEDGRGGGGGGVAWRVCVKGNYLSAVVHGSGEGVFKP